jgi:hypothetical protein
MDGAPLGPEFGREIVEGRRGAGEPSINHHVEQRAVALVHEIRTDRAHEHQLTVRVGLELVSAAGVLEPSRGQDA